MSEYVNGMAHTNGMESFWALLKRGYHGTFHHISLWGELMGVIASIDAEAHRTKVSREKASKGKLQYVPIEMNKAFKRELEGKGWQERRNTFWVTKDEKLLRTVHGWSADE